MLVEEGLVVDIAHVAGVQDCFGGADEQDSARLQRREEIPVKRVLRFLGKVNDDVAAENQVEALFERILQQVVPLELDALLDFVLDREPAVGGFREISFFALRVESFQLVFGVNARFRLRNDLDVEVGGEQAMFRVRGQFLQNHRQGIDLGADGAARAPDIEFRRPFQKLGHDLFLELAELVRRAVEFRHVDGQVLDEGCELFFAFCHMVKIRYIGIEFTARDKIADPASHLRFLVKVKVDFCFCFQLLLKGCPISFVHHRKSLLLAMNVESSF